MVESIFRIAIPRTVNVILQTLRAGDALALAVRLADMHRSQTALYGPEIAHIVTLAAGETRELIAQAGPETGHL